MIQPSSTDPALPKTKAESVRDPLRVLEALLDHVDRLSNADTASADFYGWLCTNLAALLQMRAVFVFNHHSDSGLRLVARQLESPLGKGEEARLATQLLSQRSSELAWEWICLDDSSAASRDSGQVLVARQMLNRSGTHFLVLIPKRSHSVQEHRLFADLCKELCASILRYEQSQQQKMLDEKLGRYDELMSLAQKLSENFQLQDWCRLLVNDLAAILRSDRVSLFNKQGRLLAVSGVALLNRHTQHGKQWRAFAKFSGDVKSTIDSEEVRGWSVESRKQAWQRVLEHSGAHSARLIPLVDATSTCVGVLLFENFQAASTDAPSERRFCEDTVRTLVPFVSQREKLSEVPTLRLQLWLVKSIWRRPIRSGLYALAAMGALTFLAWLTFFVPWSFEISAEGHLEPRTIQTLFAVVPGRVEKYLIPHEANLGIGTALVEMSSIELDQEITSNHGQLAESLQTLSTLQIASTQPTQTPADRLKLSSEIEQLKIRIDSLREIEKLLTQRRKYLTLSAPAAGVALTEDYHRKLLHRPVTAGEPLLEIAEVDGDWRLKLTINERHLGYLVQQQEETMEPLKVRYRLVTQPNRVFEGTLDQVDIMSRRQAISEGESQGNVITFVRIDKADLGTDLRLGTGVWARIYCGDRSGWFLMTYELRDKIREWFFY